MTRRWVRFESLDDEEFGLGTEEEAYEYAATLNVDSNCEPYTMKTLNWAQAAGLIVLVTANTFVISDALAVIRDECLLGIGDASASGAQGGLATA
jgi:hypothetical protein